MNMENKKKVLQRMALGAPLGIAIGFVISIIASLINGGGVYHSAPPALIQSMGSELNAVVFQAVMSALIGIGFSGASIIWEMHEWSLAKQSGIYFLIISLTMMPVAWFAHWMEHSLKGFLSYLAIFVGVFLVFWTIQYIIWRAKVKKLNNNLS